MTLWGFCSNAFAQKLYFSNIPRLNTKADYNRVIGENAGGIYVLRFKDDDMKSGFSIERYSHNLDFVEAENYELGKHERLIKVYTTDSGLNFLKATESKEFVSVSMLRCGFKFKNILGSGELFRTKHYKLSEYPIAAAYSNDRSKLCFWVSEPDEKNDRVYSWVVVTAKGEVFSKGQLNTQRPHKHAENSNVAVMNNGSVAMVFTLMEEDKRMSDPQHTEHFMITASPDDSGALTSFGDHKYFVSDYELGVNEFDQQFVVSGFYDYKEPDAAHGVFTLKCKGGDAFVHIEFAPFDRKFVTQIIGARAESDGKELENFFIRKLVPRNDGGLLLVAEFFEITQQMETFYLNGVPQTSSKNVYNYNDVILVSLDSAGHVEWRHVINKRQSSFASMAYLHSLGVYVCEENVNLLYNDNSGQSNRVMHIRLLRSGIMEQRIILNSDNEYTAIIPLEGRQTGYNRYVTPVLQNRQTLLLQAVDDH